MSDKGVSLYEEFRKKYPALNQSIPWIVDTQQKASFLMLKGFEDFNLMREAFIAGKFAIGKN